MSSQDTARESLAGYLGSNPDDYTVRDGVITTPGKFEGEELWVPYFYAAGLDGGSFDTVEHDDGNLSDAFELEPGEAELIGHPGAELVVLHYFDSGFVSGEAGTKAEFEKMRSSIRDTVVDEEG